MADNPGKGILFIREREINPNSSINYGMAVIATIVSKKYPVKIIDNSSQYIMYTEEDIIKMIDEFRPAVICFSIITLNALRSYRTIRAIKNRYKDIPIVAGGLHVSNVFREVLDHQVDFTVRGEADLVILSLIDELVSGRSLEEIKSYLDIQGVSYSRKANLIEGGICPLPMDLDATSFVDYHLYKLDHFMRTKSSKNLFPFVTKRGCPFRCSFCSDPFGRARVRYRSIDNAIWNIEYLHQKFGVGIINIGDADFILSEKRVIAFCNAIIEKGLNRKVKFLAQTDSYKPIRKSIFELMKRSGFNSISFGIERFDEATQKRIKKPLRRDVVLQNIANASRTGFVTQVNYLIGFPFDSERLLEGENQDFLKLFDVGVDVITVNILNPMPGTEEYDRHIDKLDRWYLNPVLLETYRPLYLTAKNLIYDPMFINPYGFKPKFIHALIKTKVLFRSESIKRKSLFLYALFQVLLFFASFSQILYRNNMMKVEKECFGWFRNFLYRIKISLAFYWAGWMKGEG